MSWKSIEMGYSESITKFKEVKGNLKEIHPELKLWFENSEQEIIRQDHLGIQKVLIDGEPKLSQESIGQLAAQLQPEDIKSFLRILDKSMEIPSETS